MELKIKKIVSDFNSKITNVTNLEQLETLRIEYFSKKGLLTELMIELKSAPAQLKPNLGKSINEAKILLDSQLNAKKEELSLLALQERLQNEKVDITLPGYSFYQGSIHPLNKVIEDVEDFFIAQGFSVAEGPELESDYYNFEMMNLAKGHPARDMQDSFYVDPNLLLRTHTSPVQARTMLAAKGAPIAIICPGKVYRRDEDDATHSHQFMQIEGLVIGKQISFAQLKDTLLQLARHLFGLMREIRVRPSYFPFTEPSVEVDVSYVNKEGKTGYLEILGAGMVHPNVLTMGGYDANKFTGFAFGIGVERIAMLKYHIDDIRHFYTNDIRFLKQFRGILS